MKNKNGNNFVNNLINQTEKYLIICLLFHIYIIQPVLLLLDTYGYNQFLCLLSFIITKRFPNFVKSFKKKKKKKNKKKNKNLDSVGLTTIERRLAVAVIVRRDLLNLIS